MNVDKMRHQLGRTAPIEPMPKWVQEQAAVFANVGIALQNLARDAQSYFAHALAGVSLPQTINACPCGDTEAS